MQKVTQHINRLLFEVDCVVIPGLGGFIANYHAASLNRGAGIIEPPSKGLIFNKNLTANDGLLTHAIAQHEKITYEQAIVLLQEEVASARYQLSQGQRIEIPDVGFLYHDHEFNLRFQPVYSVNFLRDSFGLTPVMAAAVHTTAVHGIQQLHLVDEKPVVKPVAIKNENEDDSDKIPVIVPPVKKSGRWYWAAAVLLPLAFYSVWIPVRTDALRTGKLQLSDFNPFHSSAGIQYNVRPYVHNFDILLQKEEADSLDFSHLIIVQNTQNDFEKPDAESTSVAHTGIRSVQPAYHIIAGCFQNYENAVNQVAQLKSRGLKAYLFGQSGGLHRVCVGSYTSKTKAMEQLNQLRSRHEPSVWLLQE